MVSSEAFDAVYGLWLDVVVSNGHLGSESNLTQFANVTHHFVACPGGYVVTVDFADGSPLLDGDIAESEVVDRVNDSPEASIRDATAAASLTVRNEARALMPVWYPRTSLAES